jgi:2-hydroxy-6-oxonona-2,4-dienedioate hydrolase
MTDFLDIEGIRIAYTEAGSPSNPPVILVHGITSHRGVWARTLPVLAERFHCIALDFPGFGDSDKPKGADYSIAKQAERILKVADHFGFERFTLIGHSMGGQISTYLASALTPQRVVMLVSVDGVVTGELSPRVQGTKWVFEGWGLQVFPLLRALSSWKPLGCALFAHWFYQPSALPFEAWAADRYHATDIEIALPSFAAWTSLNATDLTCTLENITAPTLVIFGAQDGTVPVAQAHLFKQKVPAAQLVLIENCGHFPMYENFEAYIQPVKEFLQIA